MSNMHLNAADTTLEPWLRNHPEGDELAGVAGLLRALMGGGSRMDADPARIGAYLDGSTPREDVLQRLWIDPALRRQVAAAARLRTHPSPTHVPTRAGRRRWRWAVGTALAAASLSAVALLPRLDPPPPGATHRAGTIEAAEVRVLGPDGVLSGAPKVEWSPVLVADLYEVEVTDADGLVVFRSHTVDTALQVPPDVLVPGAQHFYRVRARVDVGRWVASDFREFVVRP